MSLNCLFLDESFEASVRCFPPFFIPQHFSVRFNCKTLSFAFNVLRCNFIGLSQPLSSLFFCRCFSLSNPQPPAARPPHPATDEDDASLVDVTSLLLDPPFRPEALRNYALAVEAGSIGQAYLARSTEPFLISFLQRCILKYETKSAIVINLFFEGGGGCRDDASFPRIQEARL